MNQCFTDGNNAYPLASAVTGSGTTNSNLVFTCATGVTETANVSSGTNLTYTPLQADDTTACTVAPCAAFKLEAFNTGGHKAGPDGTAGATYTYDSTKGGSIQ